MPIRKVTRHSSTGYPTRFSNLPTILPSSTQRRSCPAAGSASRTTSSSRWRWWSGPWEGTREHDNRTMPLPIKCFKCAKWWRTRCRIWTIWSRNRRSVSTDSARSMDSPTRRTSLPTISTKWGKYSVFNPSPPWTWASSTTSRTSQTGSPRAIRTTRFPGSARRPGSVESSHKRLKPSLQIISSRACVKMASTTWDSPSLIGMSEPTSRLSASPCLMAQCRPSSVESHSTPLVGSTHQSRESPLHIESVVLSAWPSRLQTRSWRFKVLARASTRMRWRSSRTWTSSFNSRSAWHRTAFRESASES